MQSEPSVVMLRTRLIKDLSLLCKPCVEAGCNKQAFNLDNPLSCSCRCIRVLPLLHHLAEVEKSLWKDD